MKRFIVALIAALSLTGCYTGTPVQVTAQDTARSNQISDAQIAQAASAARAYASIHITQNGEQDNLVKYVTATTKPGYTSYVVTIAQGRIMNYYVAKGPVTDCNRELTPMQHPAAAFIPVDGYPWNRSLTSGNSYGYTTMDYTADSPNDEGTYGGNHGKCIFFYTEAGQLIRTSLDYVISDKPVRLREQPLIVSVSEKTPTQQ